MGCYCFLLFAILTIKPWETNSIITRHLPPPTRNYRRHIVPNSPIQPHTNWELGLRQAIYQTFLRSNNPHQQPQLKNDIFNAPIVGHEEGKATPFGDIAILARGQLYHTSNNLKFIQDPYQNDCDDCHNNNHHNDGCEGYYCENAGRHGRLLALWTVKRIRHRDPNYGHFYELEYIISPVTHLNENIVNRNGYFNYNIPGHVYVIRTDSRLNNFNKYLKQNSYKTDGTLIGYDNSGNKQVVPNYPAFPYYPQTTSLPTTPFDPKEFELYRKLVETLAQKNAETNHRFAFKTTPEVKFPDFVPIKDNSLPTPPSQVLASTKYFNNKQIPKTTSNLPPITTITYYTPTDDLIPTIDLEQTTIPIQTNTQKITSSQHFNGKTTDSVLFPEITTVPQRSKTTQHDIDIFPETKTEKLPKTTGKSIIKDEQVPINIFADIKKTTPKTTKKYPTIQTKSPSTQSIITQIPTRKKLNNQLQPPEKISTTLPYFTSTVTELTTNEKTNQILTEQTPTNKNPNEKLTTFYLPVPTNQPTTKETTPITMEKEVETTENGIRTETDASTENVVKTTENNENLPENRFKTTETTETSQKPIENELQTTQAEKTTKQVEIKTSPTIIRRKFKPSQPRNRQKLERIDEISNDDIFGNNNIQTTKTTSTTRKYKESEFADELFGKNNRLTTTVKENPKIIYSNFFTPSAKQPNYETTTNHPSTDQSFLTSISFQVNKKNKSTTTTQPTMMQIDEPMIMAKISEVMHNNEDYKIYKAELPEQQMETLTTTQMADKQETKKVFDNLALQLVNHARTLDYLNNKQQIVNKPKYKRRGRYLRKNVIRRERKQITN